MKDKKYPAFIKFLKEEVLVSNEELSLALRQEEPDPRLLSVTLWRYGFIPLEKLEQIFDWLAVSSAV